MFELQQYGFFYFIFLEKKNYKYKFKNNPMKENREYEETKNLRRDIPQTSQRPRRVNKMFLKNFKAEPRQRCNVFRLAITCVIN
jgi:hypothetical protein